MQPFLMERYDTTPSRLRVVSTKIRTDRGLFFVANRSAGHFSTSDVLTIWLYSIIFTTCHYSLILTNCGGEFVVVLANPQAHV